MLSLDGENISCYKPQQQNTRLDLSQRLQSYEYNGRVHSAQGHTKPL